MQNGNFHRKVFETQNPCSHVSKFVEYFCSMNKRKKVRIRLTSSTDEVMNETGVLYSKFCTSFLKIIY